MKKRTAAIILSCSIGMSALAGCSSKQTTATAVKTTEQKAVKGNLEIGLSADGKISRSITNLNFEVSGTVKKVNVQLGQAVKAGDVLAELDGTDLQLAVTQAENALSKAQANYTDAVNQRDINLMDSKNKVADAKAKWDAKPDDTSLQAAYELELKKYQTLQNSNSTIQNAKLSVEEAKNNLQEAKNKLNKIYLKAPLDGKIMNINYKVGEVVTGNQSGTNNNSASSSSAFMTIVDPSVIYVEASATESDISGIKTGQQLRVAIDSVSLENVPGEVVSVSDIPTTDSSGVVTYKVTGKLTEPNEVIKDGMTSFITFLKKEKKDVLLVPNKAISVSSGKQYVTVKTSDGKTEKRAITGGLTNGSQTEVVDGLKQGETVVIGGVQK
ncbi:efflux RND transporter periplasmic adaptor subunit [Ectobacillus ponti]|uniref:Efflux RND transporter periplasmic adaptor subunit n=1 Tax=Ectobacillus ponti TaxID=2961894 RepID=A0AA42BQ58_9BACI|nr:efflux RND transporter periplasmic adaptor subunit [Ectobacillus ponti]MCP8968094.1 efflux RND transporter periplasmic adaptor subunit [Ectobacillus ponti]